MRKSECWTYDYLQAPNTTAIPKPWNGILEAKCRQAIDFMNGSPVSDTKLIGILLYAEEYGNRDADYN